MRELIEITRALSDESRVRILMALSAGELCVCQITEMLELAPSTVSKHLSVLRQARLIESRKDGRWIHYGIDKSSPRKEAIKAMEWLIASLSDDEVVLEDRKKLEKIEKKSLSCPQENNEGGIN